MPDVARLGRDVGGGSWRGLVVHLAGIPVCLHPITHTYVHTAALVQDFKSWQRHKDDPLPTLFAKNYPSRLSSLLECEVGAGWPLAVPAQLQDEPVGGHLKHCRRQAH
jgi:hypothetical protein